MIRKTFLLFLFSFYIIPNVCFSQQWTRKYFLYRENFPNNVLESYDKGYVISGCFSQYGVPTWGLLIKTDVNGNMRWFKSIGQQGDGTLIDYSDQCADGGLILAGGTRQLGSWTDPLFLKINKCGIKEWCKIYHVNDPDKYWDSWAQRIYQLPDGGYISLVIGYGNDIINKRLWLFRLDSLGEAIWIKYYQKSDTLMINDYAYNMMVSNDFHVIISGVCDYPQPGTTLYWPRPLLVKTDSSGTIDWDLVWGKNWPYYVWAGELSQSVVAFKGSVYSSGLIDSAGRNCVMYKTSVSGNEIYHKIIMDSGEFGGAGTIDWLQDSTLVVTGGWGNLTIQTEGAFKTDTLGNILKIKELNHENSLFVDGKTTFNNKLILVSGYDTVISGTYHYMTSAWKINSDLEFDSVYTRPFVYDSLCPDSIVSDTIPLDCEVLDIEEPFNNPDKSHLRIYPNPASEMLTIEIPEYLITTSSLSLFNVKTVRYQWTSADLEAYDLNGKRVFQKKVPKGEKKVEVNVASWQPGMYMFRLIYGNIAVDSEKVIIQ